VVWSVDRVVHAGLACMGAGGRSSESPSDSRSDEQSKRLSRDGVAFWCSRVASPPSSFPPPATQYDMSTHRAARPYRLYPAYCFSASPTFNTWVKLTAANVQALRSEPDFQGSVSDHTQLRLPPTTMTRPAHIFPSQSPHPLCTSSGSRRSDR
jgi:hypothetical protein